MFTFGLHLNLEIISLSLYLTKQQSLKCKQFLVWTSRQQLFLLFSTRSQSRVISGQGQEQTSLFVLLKCNTNILYWQFNSFSLWTMCWLSISCPPPPTTPFMLYNVMNAATLSWLKLLTHYFTHSSVSHTGFMSQTPTLKFPLPHRLMVLIAAHTHQIQPSNTL